LVKTIRVSDITHMVMIDIMEELTALAIKNEKFNLSREKLSLGTTVAFLEALFIGVKENAFADTSDIEDFFLGWLEEYGKSFSITKLDTDAIFKE